ncbi:MAG: hypothetical protein IKJ41_10160 [Clostridia bacterium]|nr:hypothetical protein [Clostridia bacterium]
MEKIISFIVSIVISFVSLIFPFGETNAIETVKIDGATYQNGFVADNMHLKGEYNLYKEKPVYRDYVFTLALGYWNNYYQIEDNWIFRNENTGWGVNIKKELFCPVEEWDRLHSYYEDGNNYDYYYEVCVESGDFTKYDVQNADTTKFDEIIQFSVDNEYGSTSKNKAETITLPNTLTPVIRFYKESKDGLFTTHTTKFIVYEGNLYFQRHDNVAAGTMEVSVLPNELETYFISLLKSAGLE